MGGLRPKQEKNNRKLFLWMMLCLLEKLLNCFKPLKSLHKCVMKSTLWDILELDQNSKNLIWLPSVLQNTIYLSN